MKNLRFSRLLGVASVLSLSVALISCGTSNNLPSDANGSDIQLFTQSAKLYTSEEVRDLTTDKLEALSLGGSPENAIVPVVFAADGHLLTTTEFNDMLRKNTKTNDNFKGTKTYFTNLQTYRTMLDGNQSLKSANLDKIKYLQPRYAYALSAPEPLDSSLSTSSTDTQTEGKIYLFDAYETEYRTPAEQTKLVETKLEEAQSHQLSTQAVALPSLTAVGDFAWTNQQKSQTAISGHNGIVVALNNGGLTGGSRTAKGTMTFEARGSSGGSSANSDVKTRAQEVAKWPIGTSFGGVGRQALVLQLQLGGTALLSPTVMA